MWKVFIQLQKSNIFYCTTLRGVSISEYFRAYCSRLCDDCFCTLLVSRNNSTCSRGQRGGGGFVCPHQQWLCLQFDWTCTIAVNHVLLISTCLHHASICTTAHCIHTSNREQPTVAESDKRQTWWPMTTTGCIFSVMLAVDPRPDPCSPMLYPGPTHNGSRVFIGSLSLQGLQA